MNQNNSSKGNKINKKEEKKALKAEKASNKIKNRIQKMIQKTESLKEKKNKEIDLLNEQQNALEKLLANADNLNNKKLRDEIKNILKSYKNKSKNRKYHKKGGGHKKSHKNGKKEAKNALKKEKELKKAEKNRVRQERKAKKEERKRLKKEKLSKLALARCDVLPDQKLEIFIDGYNIIGCDKECRSNMRSKRGGMKKSRMRLINLVQNNFLNNKNKLKYSVNIWFDGGNKKQNFQSGDIQIEFSSKAQIVDDKLVEQFSKNSKKENENILVVTTDKELTLRLYEIGVKVIKSSTFYKTYLIEKEKEINIKNKNDEQDDSKDNENDDDDAVLNKFCSSKMSSNITDEDDEEEQSNTPDLADDDELIDYDFDQTFGEDMNLENSENDNDEQ